VAVTIRPTGSLPEMEGAIQAATTALGCRPTQKALKHFDTDGSPIQVEALKLNARAVQMDLTQKALAPSSTTPRHAGSASPIAQRTTSAALLKS